jgi:Uma2 family endonuclease
MAMLLAHRTYTLEEFYAFIEQPEHEDAAFEFVGGEIEPVVANWDSSMIAGMLLALLFNFVRANDLGSITGADGGYVVGKDRLIPDVAFVRKNRLTDKRDRAYYAVAPDLVVEVLSPSDKPRKVAHKISTYLAANVIVWLLDPEVQTVDIHTPGQSVMRLGIDDTLDGGTVLPGFQVAVKTLFSNQG